MRITLFALAAACLTFPAAAQAQSADHPAVVELYTSQGCSSCPPADAVFAGITGRADIIALSLHVDYWDYIGWKDTFGNKAFADRQRAYARAAGEKTIFTPQMVVNGRDKLVGADAAKLERLLRKTGVAAGGPKITLTRKGSKLTVQASASEPLPAGTMVQVVRYIPLAPVKIARGENAGRTIVYSNIVTSWQKVATWDGRAPLSLELTAPGDQPAVVIVQEPGPGAILAAAVLR